MCSSNPLFLFSLRLAAGYAFALVEPDEMPFMVDLHLFLGRRVCNPMLEMRKEEEEEETEGRKEGKVRMRENRKSSQKLTTRTSRHIIIQI